jgi:Lrp/AsnC family transcriptional regulator, regulator for asnA, asnC and gidA
MSSTPDPKGEEAPEKDEDQRVRQKKIDRVDCAIIELLQKDGRLSNTAIAKELGVSEATVRTRINRLIENEFIQIVAVSNPIKLGFEVVGTISFQVQSAKTEKIIKELKKIKEIWFVVLATGGVDIYGEFVVRSLEDLSDLIQKKIAKIDGIIRTETSLILKYEKRAYDWGTAVMDK